MDVGVDGFKSDQNSVLGCWSTDSAQGLLAYSGKPLCDAGLAPENFDQNP